MQRAFMMAVDEARLRQIFFRGCCWELRDSVPTVKDPAGMTVYLYQIRDTGDAGDGMVVGEALLEGITAFRPRLVIEEADGETTHRYTFDGVLTPEQVEAFGYSIRELDRMAGGRGLCAFRLTAVERYAENRFLPVPRFFMDPHGRQRITRGPGNYRYVYY